MVPEQALYLFKAADNRRHCGSDGWQCNACHHAKPYTGAFARPVTPTNGNAPDVGVFSANTIPPATFAAGAAVASPVPTFTVPRRRRRRSPCGQQIVRPSVLRRRYAVANDHRGDLGSDSRGRGRSHPLQWPPRTEECFRLGVAAAEGHGPRLSISFRAAGRAISTTTAPRLSCRRAPTAACCFAQTGSNQLAAGETTARMRGWHRRLLCWQGIPQLELTAPGGGNYGFVDVDGALLLSHGATPPSGWLIVGSGKGEACFGICGARTPVIYSRERY